MEEEGGGEPSFGGFRSEVSKPNAVRNTQTSFRLNDIDGDGLTDIVRITNQGIVYWPNLGYGKFGEKVVMKNAPLLDSLDQFDTKYVHLVDVDGTGTADLLYISKGSIRYYKNLSGNTWKEEILPSALAVNATPQTFVQMVDLLGNGTQCVVVSSSLPTQANKLRYWELCVDAEGGKQKAESLKPFLLKEINNNMGGITKLHYCSSTKFYMQDKFSGKPWITKLPFPVHVLEKVETIDLVGGKHFTNRYAYHHGYFDPVEREFRGFGMVEQWDSENYELQITNYENAGEYLPPCMEGAGGGKSGVVLYTVEEKSYHLKRLQKKGKNHHAIFLKTDAETLLYHYEQNANDPRILHQLVLETDEYGNETKTAEVAYPRRKSTLNEQEKILATYTENDYINCENFNARNIGILYQTKKYELHNLDYNKEKFSAPSLLRIINEGTEVDYSSSVDDVDSVKEPLQNGHIAQISVSLLKRLFQHARTLFWNQTCENPLALGDMAPHALPYQQHTLELTCGLIERYNEIDEKLTETLLTDSGYLQGEGEDAGKWFAVSDIRHFDPDNFYLLDSITDPFGNETTIEYDEYNLFPATIIDALEFETTAEYDYRVLQAKKLTDPNGNSKQLTCNTLGLVTSLTLSGKNGEGDSPPLVEGWQPQADGVVASEIYDYDLHRWKDLKKPVYAYMAKRETHADPNSRWLETYLYTDGLGNEIMTKSTAEDGKAWTITDYELRKSCPQVTVGSQAEK